MHRQRSIPKEDTLKLAIAVRVLQNHVGVLQRTVKNCTKIQNARAQPLFCSLNLLFGVALVAVAVAVVVC